jgi:hypothetical protein
MDAGKHGLNLAAVQTRWPQMIQNISLSLGPLAGVTTDQLSEDITSETQIV